MTTDLGVMIRLIEIVGTVAALCATSVPIAYAFTKWNHSILGRLFMFQAVAFALAMDCTVIFSLWQPENLTLVFWINILIYAAIAAATAGLTYKIFKYNYKKQKGLMIVSETPTPVTEKKTFPMFSNKTYDQLKWFSLIVLPAFATLYYTLSGFWGLPKPDEVVGSIVAVNTFFGLVLGLSTKAYNNSDSKYDGTIDVYETEDGTKQASLNLHNYTDPADVVQQSQVTFKVNK